jgi:inner membrane protein
MKKMTGKTHSIIGGLIAVYFSKETGTPLLVTVPATMLGALMPDIDLPNSTLGKKIKLVSRLINKIFNHRTITHSVLGMFVWFVLLQGLSYLALVNFNITEHLSQMIPLFQFCFMLGYISHIMSDIFTPKGVQLFYPYNKFFSLKLFKTGGFAEKLIFFGSFTGIILLIA